MQIEGWGFFLKTPAANTRTACFPFTLTFLKENNCLHLWNGYFISTDKILVLTQEQHIPVWAVFVSVTLLCLENGCIGHMLLTKTFELKMYMPHAVAAGKLLLMIEKMTFRNVNLSHLSYSSMWSIPLLSYSRKKLRYESALWVSVVSFTSISFECIGWRLPPNPALFNEWTLSNEGKFGQLLCDSSWLKHASCKSTKMNGKALNLCTLECPSFAGKFVHQTNKGEIN